MPRETAEDYYFWLEEQQQFVSSEASSTVAAAAAAAPRQATVSVSVEVEAAGSAATELPDSSGDPAVSDEKAPPAKRKRTSSRGYYCAVPECKNRSIDKLLSFHRFPNEDARRAEWVRAIRRDVGKNFQITSNTRVCSAHFKSDDYIDKLASGEAAVKKRLKSDALPSQFAWTAPSKSARRVLKRKRDESPENVIVVGEDAAAEGTQVVSPAQIIATPAILDHCFACFARGG